MSYIAPKPTASYCTRYEHDPEILVCYPPHMGALAKEEASHHDEDDADPVVVHQLQTYRNQYYHTYIHDLLKQTPEGSTVLEIGAGSGQDVVPLLGKYALVLSDVSPKTILRTKTRLSAMYRDTQEGLCYVVCDGEHLPFDDHTFDTIYMVATFHHFEHPAQAIKEFERVLKPGGHIVFGVEPNKTYFLPMHYCQFLLFRLTHTDTAHISKADATMTGFTAREWYQLCQGTSLIIDQLRPMWFVAGWFHYSNEAFYRMFRCSTRFVLPLCIEQLLVTIDEWIFQLPFMKHLCWHWIVSIKKKKE